MENRETAATAINAKAVDYMEKIAIVTFLDQ